MLGQMLSIIFLTGAISCNSFNWEPNVYTPDHTSEAIYSATGEAVFCSDSKIEDFACFPLDNLLLLREAIDKCERKLKSKGRDGGNVFLDNQ